MVHYTKIHKKKRRTFGRFFVVALLLLVGCSVITLAQDEVVSEEADCDACDKNCGLFDFTCHGKKLKCRSLGWVVNTFTWFSTGFLCVGAETKLEGRELVQTVKDILVSKGLFTEQEVNDVKYYFCPFERNVFAPGTAGFAPAIDTAIFDVRFLNAVVNSLASLMAHELLHIEQYRRWGSRGFGCRYGTELLKGNGFARGNAVEDEAYDFESNVADPCIYGYGSCPIDQETP